MPTYMQKKFRLDTEKDADIIEELGEGETEIAVFREAMRLRRQYRQGNARKTIVAQLEQINQTLERLAAGGLAIAGPIELGLADEDIDAVATLLGQKFGGEPT